MILIVDDISANIIALKKILELHNLPVDTANSGEEALKKILKIEYSLIIMDVQMPGMDGFEVVETLSGSNRTRDIPVIFLSAINKQKKYISKGYETGGVDYITKPVDPDLFILKVKTFLKLSEQKTELKNIRDILSKEIEIRKQAQENLSNQMEELRSVLQSLPEIAFIISKEGPIEYVNDKWFQYSSDPASFPESHPDDHHLCTSWEDHFKEGKEFACEMRIRHLATNEFRHFKMKILPILHNDAITRWVGTFTDIQEQKLANEILEEKVAERTKELIVKNQELEFSNHELQQFSWVVSHDLKEPVRKIEMFIKLLKEKYLVEDEKATNYVDRALASAGRMSKLITDLLDYSRLSAKVPFEKTDLDEVVHEVLSDFDYLIEEKNAIIKIEKLPEISSIPSQLRQVFQNLVGNSLKFSKKDIPPEIEIQSEFIEEKEFGSKPSPTGKYCRITVKDNGIGFDENYLNKIFIIFQSLNDRQAYEGTGIGLAIAKKIIEKHNGLITAKSEIGIGSCFIIILPV
ncbi:signal transduction histidine kinase/CheY-like chemotaxis protein [Flavobacterium arsenatis]|uniref:histidine kinase n=1 Tax=Flavobacterium arsenatis TaxID=1484332 RepID=A0ABU1TNL9_9FLAO|nr:response regulator [Flavobacterium arsenatis]MDR6967536.1 signal transduction histidine kinase/CheY-like chemotaxis protein [Flavobacterium arsenatis]